MSRVLYIGDIHCPVAHPGYLSFNRHLRDKWKIDKVVFIGDVVDWHAISFHSKHPEAPGPKDEYNLALYWVKRWHRVFKDAEVRIGNHDERINRVAEENGIPKAFLKPYDEIWETPGWKWTDSGIIDGVFSFHGNGSSGMHPAFTSVGKRLMSVVQGHVHSAAGIKWRASPERRVFGMDTGCGIDDREYAFAYGKSNAVRSILGSGVVIDGIPYHEVMPIGPGERYHRRRFRSAKSLRR
jgi:hypothetical protein